MGGGVRLRYTTGGEGASPPAPRRSAAPLSHSPFGSPRRREPTRTARRRRHLLSASRRRRCARRSARPQPRRPATRRSGSPGLPGRGGASRAPWRVPASGARASFGRRGGPGGSWARAHRFGGAPRLPGGAAGGRTFAAQKSGIHSPMRSLGGSVSVSILARETVQKRSRGSKEFQDCFVRGNSTPRVLYRVAYR